MVRAFEPTPADDDREETLRVIQAAIEAGESPLRVLGVHLCARSGLLANGAQLGELLGTKPSAGRKARAAYRRAMAHLRPAGPSGTASGTERTGTTGPERTGSGPLRTENGPDLGGLGGVQSPPAWLELDLDPKAAKARPCGPASIEEGAETAGGHPPKNAAAAASEVLRVLLPEDVVRHGMRHLVERWRDVGRHTAKEPVGWCIGVVSGWMIDHGAPPERVAYARKAARNRRRAQGLSVGSSEQPVGEVGPMKHCGDFTVQHTNGSVSCTVCGTVWRR